ncbi:MULTISPECIES: DUF5667 domain-containing protein [Streptomyces]|uniref:DUF5667 domain-containing protein n=1 Tax=Streptomyces lonegramiae TaxID=3075524 RepID=A0ABU2XKI5_9ACTN|nr:DUF5667 domain-containing protein [Streptomyces sp. DSM 41529]MDT0546015.1 DUF5667 domain-containing protein [Streptomyces sp. DSM 41529]
MIANVSGHRRANAFAKALEALEALERDNRQDSRGAAGAEQPGSSADSAEHRRLLALTDGLGELPAPTLDPEVRVTQRAQLVAAMEAAFAEGAPQVPGQRPSHARRAAPLSRLRPRSRWSKGLAAGGLTVGVAAGAFGGVAAASSDALPGDTLYGFKRGIEDLKLEMADDDADRGRLYLDQASTRMSEARRLMERGRSGDLDHESLREIRKTLAGMHHDVSEGHRLLHKVYERDGSLGPMRTLSSFSRSHRDGWSQLREKLPIQLMDVGEEVNSVFDAIEQEVGPLQSLLPSSRDGRDQHSGRTTVESPERGASGGADIPAPAATTPSATRPGDDARPGPSSSPRPEDGGLIGGAGDLLNPPTGEPLPLPSSGKGDPSGRPTQPEITIPPLLPNLLPGLGLDGDGK